jgi:hypothetical protein
MIVCQGLEEGEMGIVFNGYTVSVLQDVKNLEIHGCEGFTKI